MTTLRVCNCLVAGEFLRLPQRPLLAGDRSNTLAAGDNFGDKGLTVSAAGELDRDI